MYLRILFGKCRPFFRLNILTLFGLTLYVPQYVAIGSDYDQSLVRYQFIIEANDSLYTVMSLI